MQNHEKASLQATSVHESTLHDAQNSLKDGEEKVRRGKARAGVNVFISYKKEWSSLCSYTDFSILL